MIRLIDYLRARPQALKLGCYIVLGLVLCYSLYVDKSHAHTWVEKHVPFFWSLFGFCAAGAIIGIAHWYGRSGIMTRTDYYDTSDD